MPIPAATMKLTCRACGWHRVYLQRSDVLLLPDSCEACGSTELTRSVAGPLDGPAVLIERLRRFWLRRRLRAKR